MGVGGTTSFGGGFFLLRSSGGEATGTPNMSWPVGGVCKGAEWPFIRGEGAGCVD